VRISAGQGAKGAGTSVELVTMGAAATKPVLDAPTTNDGMASALSSGSGEPR
jgi:hypothetical protein